MNLNNLFIYRNKDTNVFNLIENNMASHYAHLSTTVDDDLIQEFLTEMESLGHLIKNIDNVRKESPKDLLQNMKQIGETFFSQFFPEEIQRGLWEANESFLFLHVSPNLASIPWELLYNRDHFLASRFYLARTNSSYWHKTSVIRKESLRILIVTDPTGDLEWARREGEMLYDALHSELKSNRINVHILGGKRVTKLELLHAIKECDIIHYAGHTYEDPDPNESGWLLADGKVLRAREIGKSKTVPMLVFSNSCLSSTGKAQSRSFIHKKSKPYQLSGLSNSMADHFGNLADAFLHRGICNYVGTNWEFKDSQDACDFALHFYRFVFEEEPLGQALFHTREIFGHTSQNSLIWTNYALHGDPAVRISRFPRKRSYDASRTKSLVWRIHGTYPFPIVRSYLAFLGKSRSCSANERMDSLCEVFQSVIQILSSIVFSVCRYLNQLLPASWVNTAFVKPGLKLSLKQIIDSMYQCNDAIFQHRSIVMPMRLLKNLQLHRAELVKLARWYEEFYSGSLAKQGKVEVYIVTFQYLLENFLDDLNILNRCHFVYVQSLKKPVILLNGDKPRESPMSFLIHKALQGQEEIDPKVYIFYPPHALMLPLDGYLSYDVEKQKLDFSLLH